MDSRHTPGLPTPPSRWALRHRRLHMEWLIVRMRYAMTLAGFKKSKWQAVAFILGALLALAVIVITAAGSVMAGRQLRQPLLSPVASMVTVSTFTGIGFWWLVMTLFISGQGGSLDIRKFARYGIPDGKVTRGILLSGMMGIPFITTLICMVLTSFLWSSAGIGVMAGAAAGGILSAVTVIMVSRALAQLADTIVTTKKGRMILNGIEVAVIIALCYVPSFGGSFISMQLSGKTPEDIMQIFSSIPAPISILGWLPFGAGAMIPNDIAAGNVALCVLRILIMAAVIAVCYWVYRFCLKYQAITPPTAGVSHAKGLGAFNHTADSPSGAVVGRLITSWMRDARYLSQLMSVMFIIVAYSVMSIAMGPKANLTSLFTAPVVGFVFGTVEFNNLAYDGRAFSLFVTSGVPGRNERIARLSISSVIGAALMFLSFAITLMINPLKRFTFINPVSAYTVLFGISVCLLLTGLGMSAVLSTYIIAPVPSADQPFKSPQGRGGLRALVPLIFILVELIPCILPGVLGFFALRDGNLLFALASGILALAIGGGIFMLGIALGGRSIDRRSPEILVSLENVAAAAGS